MNNVSSVKSQKIESPKTPGGISKSLLTPCRRVGLSRKWKNPGTAPFISPLANSNTNSPVVNTEKKESRKRKNRILDEDSEKVEEKSTVHDDIHEVENCVASSSTDKNSDISGTPVRVELPRKKSKLIKSISREKPIKIEPDVEVNKDESNRTKGGGEFATENLATLTRTMTICTKRKPQGKASKTIEESIEEETLKPLRVMQEESESKISIVKDDQLEEHIDNKDNIILANAGPGNKTEKKQSSPKELTKECIVVIQKKIFKTDKKVSKSDKKEKVSKNKDSIESQTMFESDSDDVPLSKLNKDVQQVSEKNTKENVVQNIDKVTTLDKDADFIENDKVKKLEDKKTSTTTLRNKTKKNKQKQTIPPTQLGLTLTSQSSVDDDDDFDFSNKRTILIRKTYEKITKPSKAKSTGSVTQKDIDEIKARIEMKKQLLVAKAMSEDTEELRSLIKKWQKGCQDALVELLDLMKMKFPDRHNMDFSEMLQMLRIPANLVGYDSDNDCFNTPDDANIILSKFNNI